MLLKIDDQWLMSVEGLKLIEALIVLAIHHSMISFHKFDQDIFTALFFFVTGGVFLLEFITLYFDFVPSNVIIKGICQTHHLQENTFCQFLKQLLRGKRSQHQSDFDDSTITVNLPLYLFIFDKGTSPNSNLFGEQLQNNFVGELSPSVQFGPPV